MTALSTRPGAAAVFPAPTPRRTRKPTWLDFRLIAGVVLVLIAVLAGSAVVSSADHRSAVWVVSRDLSAGSVLRSSDLRPARVQLGAAQGFYFRSTEAVVGQSLRFDIKNGELLSRSSVAPAPMGVTVTLPIQSQNAPSISRGDRITVWVTTKTCRAVVVVSGVDVQDVKTGGASAFSSGATIAVVLRLPSARAERVIAALDLDSAVLRVGVLAAGEQVSESATDLTSCAPVNK